MLRLAFALFAVQAGFHGFTASLPVALARSGVADPEIGLIVGVAALVQVPAAFLAGVIVDRLFAQDHKLRLLFVHHGLDQLGNGQRLQFGISLHQGGTIGTNGQGRTQGFLALCNTARQCDNFCGCTAFFEASGLFDSDFVKRVHGHFHIGNVHPGLVRFHAHLDVIVNYAFHGY